jgi:hypothetical protein
MSAGHSVAQQIALVERKLEIRRERTHRHWGVARAHVEHSTRWLPLVAAVGALVVGVAAGRQPRKAHVAGPRKSGLFAALAALGATGVRIALSPAGRAAWSAIKAGRPR